MSTYGYIRVLTKEQNLDRQIAALAEAGITDQFLFSDKQSGKDFDRPAYQKLLATLQPGDLLVIKSIDRLGRNYEEIIEQWRELVKKKFVDIRVLDMPMLDTTIHAGGLTGAFIADLVLQLLAYFAQPERDSILQRQKEGMKCARERGVVFGRPVGDKPEGYQEAVEKYRQGKITAREAGRRIGVSHVTFLKWYRKESSADS